MFYYIGSDENVDEISTDDHIDHELGLREIAQQIVKAATQWIKELGGEDQKSHCEPVLIEHFAILDLLPPIFSSAIQDEGQLYPAGEDKQMAAEWITGLLDMMVCGLLCLCLECSGKSCMEQLIKYATACKFLMLG